MRGGEMFEALVGQSIRGWRLSDDRETLTLDTDAGVVTLITKGDCCSDTWIESLDNPDALGGKVLSVEEIEMPDLGNVATPSREYVDEVRYYGLRIATGRGICVLDYRNSSNGFYGGDIRMRFDLKAQ